MDVRLVSQPYAAKRNVVDFLQESLADQQIQHLDIVVAWLKRSGMRQVIGLLSEFRARGGWVRIIVGVSQGGATRQGLEFAIRESDEAFVFHDPSGRTFHPKLYHARGADHTYTLIGSQNFTRGGLIENYELGVEIRASPHASEDEEFLRAVEENINDLLNEPDACMRLTAKTLAQILSLPAITIKDEDKQASDQTPRKPTHTVEHSTVFGRVLARLRRAKGVVTVKKGGTRAADATSTTSAGKPSRTDLQPADEQVVRRWFKELDTSNAQRLPEGQNPTGHLTLTKAGLDIAAATYFRDEFFTECNWTPSTAGNAREFAIVQFEVFARGKDLGTFALRVDHFPDFGSGQGNRTSTLRWGSDLNRYLRREVDHTGDYVTIEALANGSFNLIFAAGPYGWAIL